LVDALSQQRLDTATRDRLIGSTKETPSEVAEQWARVEIKAAIDGTILEQNVAVGDIVTPMDDLFKIANLSRLRVIASAYEEDLPRLDAMPIEERKWSITIPAEPNVVPIPGSIEQIGKIIDPTQHTAFVMGWVPNLDGKLRAGQFISAGVAFASPGNEVVLPSTAVIEKGGESFVFVAEGSVDTKQPTVFARRSVLVSRQIRDQVCILINPPSNNRIPCIKGLKPGDNVVTSGGVELQQTLMDLTADKQ